MQLYLNANPNDPQKDLLEKLTQPTAIWLTGGTQAQVYAQVQSTLKDAGCKLVTFVVYNIPIEIMADNQQEAQIIKTATTPGSEL